MRERTEEEPKKKIISLRCFDFSFFTLPLRPLKDKNALNLIIDIGNTAAKVALFDGGEMVEVLTESNQSLDCLEALCVKYPVEQGIVATVIDLSERVLAALVACLSLCCGSIRRLRFRSPTCTKLPKRWDTTEWLLWWERMSNILVEIYW